MKYFSKIATMVVLAVGLTACGERPPLPNGDGATGEDNSGSETTREAVLPSCRSTDHVTGSYTYNIWKSNGVDKWQNGTGTMYLYCTNNNNDTGVSLVWGSPGVYANFTAHYFGQTDWTQDWMWFDFTAPDGNRFVSQAVSGTGSCHHAGGINRWRCPLYVLPAGGGQVTASADFVKQ